MSAGKYILEADGRTPRLVSDVTEWGRFFEDDARRRVDLTLVGNVRVSTVFLGLDHNFGRGKPILWETMVFGGEHDGYEDRYTSYADAVAGHQKAVELVRGKS